jgi:predicted RecB family endonuclease
VPPDQPSVAGSNIRLGAGSLDVFASQGGSTYTTRIDASSVGVRRVRIGYALPRGSTPVAVTLDGRPVSAYDTRSTNRGLELSVVTGPGAHTLSVVTG